MQWLPSYCQSKHTTGKCAASKKIHPMGSSIRSVVLLQLVLIIEILCSVDNCSTAHNLTFSLSTIFNGTILDTVANPHYQFRIDLSRADHCHCLTVDSATGVIGNFIFTRWRDGSFWCGSNIIQLCASNSESNTFYSALISRNGSLMSVDHHDLALCDNSTALNISINSQVSNMISGMNLAYSFLYLQVVAMHTFLIYRY